MALEKTWKWKKHKSERFITIGIHFQKFIGIGFQIESIKNIKNNSLSIVIPFIELFICKYKWLEDEKHQINL